MSTLCMRKAELGLRVQHRLNVGAARSGSQPALVFDFLFPTSPAITSIQQLPNETLADIFIMCQAIQFHDKLTRFQQPIVAQVCSLWRRISCATPRLWDSIFVTIPSYGAEEKVKTWLIRSGFRPLDITILPSRGPPQQVCKESTSKIATLLNDQSHRWRSCSIEAPSIEAGTFFKQTSGIVTNLRTLEFRSSDGLLSFSAQFSSRPWSAPLVVSLSRTTLSFDRVVAAAFKSLRITISDAISSECIYNAVSSCVDLRMLSLGPQWTSSSAHPRLIGEPSPALILPQLESLIIWGIEGFYRLLHAASFPSLFSLKITEFSWTDGCAASIARIFESSPALNDVHVRGKGGPVGFPSSSRRILLPQLVQLSIRKDVNSTNLLSRLLLPQVEVLDIEGRMDEQFFTLIRGSPLLTTISFDGQKKVHSIPLLDVGRVKLPYLREVTLKGDFDPVQFLNAVQAPHLNTLRLVAVGRPQEHTLSVAAHFSNDDPPVTPPTYYSLQTLILDTLFSIDTQTFDCLLRTLERLTSLTISRSEIPDETIAILACQRRFRCPLLTRLSLHDCPRIFGRTILTIIATRRQDQAPGSVGLRYVAISNCTNISAEDSAKVTQLMKN